MSEQYNPCKARECKACCQDMIMSMSLKELDIFSRTHIQKSGNQPQRLRNRIEVEEQKKISSPDFLGLVIWYSATKSLEQYKADERYGDKEALVYIEGTCANNINGECTIYESRPECCKNFGVDTKLCQHCQLIGRKRTPKSVNPVPLTESFSSLSTHSVPVLQP